MVVRTKNEHERKVVNQLEEDGWEVLKRGWPDFLAYKDGKVRLIEVKPPRMNRKTWEDLKTTQRRVAEIFSECLGVEVEVANGGEPLKEGG